MPAVWYHGSPWGDMGDISSYRGDLMFLTDSRSVALEYNKPLNNTGRRPTGDVVASPVLYSIELQFGSNKVFDTRTSAHLAIFQELIVEGRVEDPEDPPLRKSDLVVVHPAPGSSIGGVFPGFGCARYILPRLFKRGFVAAFIAEGSQGASLAVNNPRQNLKIADRTSRH